MPSNKCRNNGQHRLLYDATCSFISTKQPSVRDSPLTRIIDAFDEYAALASSTLIRNIGHASQNERAFEPLNFCGQRSRKPYNQYVRLVGRGRHIIGGVVFVVFPCSSSLFSTFLYHSGRCPFAGKLFSRICPAGKPAPASETKPRHQLSAPQHADKRTFMVSNDRNDALASASVKT